MFVEEEFRPFPKIAYDVKKVNLLCDSFCDPISMQEFFFFFFLLNNLVQYTMGSELANHLRLITGSETPTRALPYREDNVKCGMEWIHREATQNKMLTRDRVKARHRCGRRKKEKRERGGPFWSMRLECGGGERTSSVKAYQESYLVMETRS